ncbi:MAG: low specificity L-threonine aldolase [Spirochaetota bacterium]
MDKLIDLRSDTVTKPTPEMRRAMYEAEVGDDVLGEDPTVQKLEEFAADRLGKEASLFVVSGTFGNQLSLFTHCERGSEIIISETTHIIEHEVGAASVIASTHMRTIMPEKPYLTWNEIEKRIRSEENIHYPKTGAIALENGLSNGDVQPVDEMQKIFDGRLKIRKEKGITVPIHLDGARIFNAALYLSVDVKTIAACSDSVMFCLSKGLCAPVGSIVAGSKEFITKARKLRKMMGGGLRQAGILAAAGIIAIEKMSERLKEDHDNAGRLAKAFSQYEIFEIRPPSVKINMFFARIKTKKPAKTLADCLKNYGVLVFQPRDDFTRFVTHHDVTGDDINYIISILPRVVKECSN